MDEETTTDDKVGVLIEKCDFEKHVQLNQPVCSVELVDSRTGTRLGPSVVITKHFAVWKERLEFPAWHETVIIDYNFDTVSNRNNTHLLFLFDICDDIQEPPSLFQSKRNDPVHMRLAWAFLKPVASTGDLNVYNELRLQLYKLGKKCPVSHHTCPVFHLYSEHKRRKYPGSLYVLIKSVQPVSLSQPPDINPDNTEPLTLDTPTKPSAAPIKIAASDWSRLPTQSCKLPNCKDTMIPISRRGCSSLAFSPSGKLLACGSFAKIVIVNVIERREVTRLSGHSGLIYELHWSPNEKFLLSVSADCSSMIWNMNPLNKTPIYVLPHPSFVYCGKWLTNQRLVTGGKDGKLRYWGLTDSGIELLEEFGSHGHGFISAVQVAAEDMLVSGDSLGNLIISGLTDGKWGTLREFNIRQAKGCAIDYIMIHPGGKRLAVTSRTQGTFMLDIATGSVMHSYLAGNLNARNIPCLSPCGSLLFAFGPKNVIYVWDFETGRLLISYTYIFPDGQAELAGVISYHPWEHLVAFCVLGDNYPVVLLSYSQKDEDQKLGLVHHCAHEVDFVATPEKTSIKVERETFDRDSSIEDKLAAIVRNIDRVLAAKREMVSRVSSSYGQKKQNIS